MLNAVNGAITETLTVSNASAVTTGSIGIGGNATTTNCVDYSQPFTYWNSWPVYVCTDKTAKAIQILKMLQAEDIIDVKSVPKFIGLVEKIAKTL